ncbi:Carbohydrate family 9 binding domain-like [Tenacibaculum sp. MAR_2009_124]|nr:Carbohydrate family 9 binding domain-like [Tenacibaculum sp. MAR_2009_124]
MICCMGMKAQSITPEDIKDIETPKLYVSDFVSKAPLIDGFIDSEIWNRAQWSETFIDIEGKKKPKYKTNFKMLWDNENVYILAKLQDEHIWGTLKQRDTIIFNNNCFEIFLDPDGNTHNYMELEINALNTVWDLFISKPYRNNPEVKFEWDIQGIKTEVSHEGTLNNSNDIDKGWVIEMALPWKSLNVDNDESPVGKGRFWRMNFMRVHWNFLLDNGKYKRVRDYSNKLKPSSNWVWSSQGAVNIHQPEKWGYVYFNKSDETVDINELPIDAPLIQWMYIQYRQKLRVSNNVNEYSRETVGFFHGAKVVFKRRNIDKKWFWYCESPLTKKQYLISNDGKLSIIKK